MNKIIAILLSFAVISITGCNQGGGTTVAGAAPSVSALSLSTTQITVNSDSSDSATVTATVLDSSNAAMEGVTVNFSSSGGQLSAASAVTNSSGQAEVLFSSGTIDPSNQTATITAVVGTVSSLIPIQITGSTVTITTPATTLSIGGTPTDITVLAANAGGIPVAGSAVTLTMSGTGTATLASATGTTNASGEFVTTIDGNTAGTVTLTASALGATASTIYTIDLAGSAFQITAPTVDPATMDIGGTLDIVVNAPASANVTFVTSHGTWVSSGTIITTTAGMGTVTETLTAATGGTASINVFDDSVPSSLTDSHIVHVVNSTVNATDKITVSASPITVPTSSGDATYISTITATVEDNTGQPVSSAAVVFSLSNTVGGGEFVSPSFALTGLDGVATATFTSGSISTTGQGVTVTATLYDSSNANVDTATTDILITNDPGSVVIGTSTEIISDTTNTYYILPMAVQVANSGGGPAAGAVVSLKIWPKNYQTGAYGGSPCGAGVTGTFINEDDDRDLTLDTGEDTSGDGELTPHNSAGGTIPGTVTTDENGIATFDLVYLKNYASWIEDEITASTEVSGTETIGTLNMVLPYATDDCEHLPPSPFN